MDKPSFTKIKKNLIKKIKKSKLFSKFKQFNTTFLQKKIKTESELKLEKQELEAKLAKETFLKQNRKNKRKQALEKIKKISSKILDADDRRAIKGILAKVILFGIPINFAIFVLSKGFYTFNSYSWIGWGMAFWILKKEVEPMLRNIIHK